MKELRTRLVSCVQSALMRLLKVYLPCKTILILTGMLCCAATSYGQESIDYRYAPEYWYSAIGFPGDYHKTLVNEAGSLLYDFGPGPYVRANTVISFGLTDDEVTLDKQYYTDARIPVVLTDLSGAQNRVLLKTFSLVPETFSQSPSTDHAVWRTNGLTGSQAWASPPDSVDPAFRNVAWGTNRPIEYHLRVEKGKGKTVVLGFCESYRKTPGLRTLELHVEGAAAQTIDPLAAGPANTPQIYQFAAKDTNSDGVLDIEILSPKGDPNTLLNVIWVFPADHDLDESALIRGTLSSQAEIYLDAGREPQVLGRSPRFDVLHGEVSGGGTPRLSISTKRRLVHEPGADVVFADGIAFIKLSPAPARVEQTEQGLDLIFAQGTARVLAVVQDGFETDPAIFPELSEIDVSRKTEQYWLEDAGIPYDRIIVPDARLQDILTSSIRTFYQSSETVDGFLQFQPGVALYRGLWMHDGVYFAELALQLGDVENARQILEGYLRHQHESGQVEVMRPNNIHRETPLLIWALCRYAALTGDDAWLQARWDHIERGIEWLDHLRKQTLHPGAPNYGLTPAGFADGGVGGVQPEYATVNWILISLLEAIETANRYGKHEQAESWQQLYELFLSSFRTAMERDKQQDKHGNWFLPVLVGATDLKDVPQRGQWMLPEALMHGRHILPNDPLVDGTLAMLESNSVQGLITSVGWLTDGIWVYYGGFLAEAYLKRGEGEKAAAILYAMANHASPVATWPEEQMPIGKGRRTVGDFPHAWASSTMARLAIRLLAMEDGNDLVLFRGLPPAWLHSGACTELKDVATRFGRVRLKLQVSQDGEEVSITLSPLSAAGDGKIVMDMRAFKAIGFTGLNSEATPKWGAPFEIVLRMEDE